MHTSHTRAAPQVNGTHTLRPVDLMSAHGHQIHIQRVDIEGDLSNCLRSVRVQKYAYKKEEKNDYKRLTHRTVCVYASVCVCVCL